MAQILKEHKRAAIIAATIEQMKDKGIENIDMRSVAKNAGITVGNLYHYFEDKQSLIQAITGPIFSQVNDILNNHSKGTFSLYNKKKVKMTLISMSILSHRKVFQNILMDCYLIMKENPEITSILIKDNYTKNVLNSWLEELWISDKQDVKLKILLKAHISGVVNGATILLQEGLALRKEDFEVLSNFYISSANDIILKIIGNKW